MDSELKAFYEYNSTHFERWTGGMNIMVDRYIACLTETVCVLQNIQFLRMTHLTYYFERIWCAGF